MAKTQARGTQILDGSVQRVDLDVTTVGQSVIAKLIAAGGILLTATGGDAGTGDVTVSVQSPVPLQEIATPATPASGTVSIYTKSDHLLYIKNSAGVETQIGTSAITVAALAPLVNRLDLSKFIVYGHSLAVGGAASDVDRDVTTKLSSMLKMREIPRAVGGAILHWAQANVNGDGGYAHVLQNEIRKVRKSTTLAAQATAGATSITPTVTTGWTVGMLVHLGNGNTGGSGGETAWITSVGATLGVTTVPGTTTGLARTHASGQALYEIPSAYQNLNPLYMAWYGGNDLAVAPITSAAAKQNEKFTSPLRLILARMRCAEVYENDHSSVVYSGSWTGTTATTSSNSGANVNPTAAVNAAATIGIPDNFPGGAIAIGFVSDPAWTTDPVFSFTVDGVSFGTLTLHGNPNALTKNNGYCKRLTGLSAGRHEIVVTCTTFGVGGGFGGALDWWGIESPYPPLILVPSMHRPYKYSLWDNTWPNAQRTTTLTGLHNSGVSSFTVASTASWLVGATVTFEEGTGNAESLEIATVPTGTTFTTTAVSTKSHAGATAVVSGIQDADVPKLNTNIQAICNEFDNKVMYVDIDTVINKNSAYFYGVDGVHLNDDGYRVLVKTYRDAVESNTGFDVTLASNIATPTAPLPVNITFFTPGVTAAANVWTNQPAALTELFGLTQHRKFLDLRRCFEARFVVNVVVAGVAGAGIRLQYSLDSGTTWKYIDRTALYAEGLGLEALLTSTGTKDSGFWPIAAEALVDNVLLRVVGINGNAVADPQLGNIELYVR